MGDSKEKEPVSFETGSFSRGTRTRTQNKGFGDPRVTITPYPYVARRLLYSITFSGGCQAEFEIFCKNPLPFIYLPGSRQNDEANARPSAAGRPSLMLLEIEQQLHGKNLQQAHRQLCPHRP